MGFHATDFHLRPAVPLAPRSAGRYLFEPIGTKDMGFSGD